jgi:hypothetical protein
VRCLPRGPVQGGPASAYRRCRQQPDALLPIYCRTWFVWVGAPQPGQHLLICGSGAGLRGGKQAVGKVRTGRKEHGQSKRSVAQRARAPRHARGDWCERQKERVGGSFGRVRTSQ